MSYLKDALKAAEKVTAQTITLATGTLVLSTVFIGNIFEETPNFVFLILLSWGLLTVSILTGLLTLMSVVNKYKKGKLDPFDKVTSIPAAVCIIFFLLGLLSFWIFTALNIYDC